MRSSQTSIAICAMSTVAVVFGLLTLKSGGAVLFVDGADRAAAGNFVSFVLWFNFLAGFLYLVAGVGLFLRKSWAVWLAGSIAGATGLVFLALGIHILGDGLYEARTIGAMVLRTTIWAVIAVVSHRKIMPQS